MEKTGCHNFQTKQTKLVRCLYSISLGCWTELGSTPPSQVVHMLEYRPLNQPITVHVVSQRYNDENELLD